MAHSRAKTKALAATIYDTGTNGRPRFNTSASAAPNAAADDTPNVNGLASGLFSTVCISAPARPRAAPARRALTARGNRIGQIRAAAISFPVDASRARHTTPHPKGTG